MAARKNKGTVDKPWPDKVRDRIKTSMLLNRLEDHVVGKVEMSPTQLQAATVLLKKSLPDLSAISHTGEDGGPIKHNLDVRFV